MITLDKLSRETHLSISTVRRALKNLPDVDLRTKRKVSCAAKKFGYRPNLLARGLITRRTGVIGVSVPDIQLSFYPELIKGIESELKTKEYRVILWDSEGTAESLINGLEIFRDYMVEGVIFVPVPGKDKKVIKRKIRELSVPYVFVDEYIDSRSNFVVTDDEEGGKTAVSYLISLGHRTIAHFSGPLEDSSALNRLNGYKKALSEAKIKFNHRSLFESDFTEKGGYECADNLLDNNTDVTAIFCANDAMAIGCMKLLLSRNVEVPQEMAVVGYGNYLNYGDFLKIPLTTISQPAKEMGRISASMLIETIEGKLKQSRHVFLKTKLITRESSGSKY